MNNDNLNVISLFSGGGGIDLGFKNAGFSVAYATDNWQVACNTLALNESAKTVECIDCREIDFKNLPERLGLKDIDVLVGGPPCPAYSKSRFYLKNKKRALEDENSFTLTRYVDAINEIHPKVFFFENVFGFVYKPHKDAFTFLTERAKEFGYEISFAVLNAADYGVPQIRQRFICIGVRKDLNKKFVFPEPSFEDPKKRTLFTDRLPWVTCREAIGDLDVPLPEDKDMVAGSKHKDLLPLVPPGDNYLFFTEKRGYPNPIFKWRSRYWSFLLKLSPEMPSWTIQASHSNNMGPFHWRNRFLRISEIKRIQTFNDEYRFTGTRLEQWRQIGNAVPPLLVKVIAEEIKKQVFED